MPAASTIWEQALAYFANYRFVLVLVLLLAIFLNFVFRWIAEEKLGDFGFTVNSLTLVQVVALLGTILVLGYEWAKWQWVAIIGVTISNAIVHLLQVRTYAQMRNRWKSWIETELQKHTDMQSYQRYTILATMTSEPDFIPDSLTQRLERAWSENDQGTRAKQKQVLREFLRSQGFTIPDDAFDMPKAIRDHLARRYSVLGWASFILFLVFAILSSWLR